MLNRPATMNAVLEYAVVSDRLATELAGFARGINPNKPSGIKASRHSIQSKDYSVNKRPNNRLEPTAAQPFAREAPRLKTQR